MSDKSPPPAIWIVRPNKRNAGLKIRLLTLEEFLKLKEESPNNTLITISGETVTAAEMDDDTRYGYIAAGIPVED